MLARSNTAESNTNYSRTKTLNRENRMKSDKNALLNLEYSSFEIQWGYYHSVQRPTRPLSVPLELWRYVSLSFLRKDSETRPVSCVGDKNIDTSLIH